jgi:ElaB/YqjD/DUF883 family membrane-anchored ribosome-binding protein
MSMLDRIKALVFVDETAEAQSRGAAAGSPTSFERESSSYVSLDMSSWASTDNPANYDVAAIEARIDLAIKRNVEFAPFGKFLELADNIKTAVPDEAQRFKAAQAATNMQTEVLLAAVSSYVDILQVEAARFERNIVSVVQSEIEALGNEEKELGDQIAELTAQLADVSAQKAQIARSVLGKARELNEAKTAFEAVAGSLERRYHELAQKTQLYLRRTPNR